MNMNNHFLSVILSIILITIFIPHAHSKRLALVIGNNEYNEVSKLQKAVNDSQAIASVLREIGFEVTQLDNLKSRDMNFAIYSDFISKIQPDDEVFFYYAGHGVEIRNRNYLLPIDIPKVKPGNERFVTKESFAIDEIIYAIDEKKSRISIIVIDACRDNPFPRQGTRSLGSARGLTRIEPPRGTFVMFSAGFRQTALDRLGDNDPNPNSVYTRKILPLLKTPGLKLTDLAKRLRGQVEELAQTVNHNQYPAYYDQVKGDYYFVPSRDKSRYNPQKSGAIDKCDVLDKPLSCLGIIED